MTKEQLETNLAALKMLQSETNEKLADHKVQISLLEKQLKDINKTAITPMDMDSIYEAVEKEINDFDFEDGDNYDFEFEMEYDGRVSVSSTNFTNEEDLVQAIVDRISNIFKEADCPEDEPTADQLNTQNNG